MGQLAQPQPQEDLPAFLFFIILNTIPATTKASTMQIITLAILIAAPFAQLINIRSFIHSNFVASEYFLKNSIYTITAKTASAAINPMIFILPAKTFPNWFTIRAIA